MQIIIPWPEEGRYKTSGCAGYLLSVHSRPTLHTPLHSSWALGGRSLHILPFRGIWWELGGREKGESGC